MDRSFLSDRNVIEASRDFVCIRLATYEDSEEAKFLEELYGRTLANTLVALLDSDGKTQLSRPGRHAMFSSRTMKQLLTDKYQAAGKQRWRNKDLPEMKSVSLAINVASCDYIPVVLAVGKDAQDLEILRKQLLPVAWQEELGGQFVFASATEDMKLRNVQGLKSNAKRGIHVLAPEAYGLYGRVVASLEPGNMDLDVFRKAIMEYKPPAKNHRTHTSFGVQMGFRWDTETPVTDQQFVRATERVWGEKYEHRPPKKDE